MASNTETPNAPRDWLTITQEDMVDVTTSTGRLKDKPLSHFDALSRSFVGDANLFQLTLAHFPQNFMVMAGHFPRVRVMHSLLSVPDPSGPSLVVGIYGVNKLAPFKMLQAPSAALALKPPAKKSGSKKSPDLFLPTIAQFSAVNNAQEFSNLVGKAGGTDIGVLASFPNVHLLHPHVFVDLGGKRDWEASTLGYKIISLYADDDPEELNEEEDEDDPIISPKLQGVYQLLIFLWALSSAGIGTSVPLVDLPELGEVTFLCERKSSILSIGSPTGGSPPVPESFTDNQRLTEAMVLNLNKSSEAYVRQINKDDTTKSSLSRLAPDQASLFHLLTAENFEVEGTPSLNTFTRKLTESRDPMRAINMVRQATRLWQGSITDKSLIQLLSSGYLAPQINQEPDGLTSLGFVPHYKRHRFEEKGNASADNVRAMFGEKTFDESSIKRYTKKQFFLPSCIEDWRVQLYSTAQFIDLLTCEEGIASEAYRTALALYDQHQQTFRAAFIVDKAMGVKISYFLDRVFQEFATDLCLFAGEENPLRSASPSLRGRQRNTVLTTLGPLRYGIKPTIALPPGLLQSRQSSSNGNPTSRSPSNDDVNGGRNGEAPRIKSVTPPDDWKIPRGKNFGDFFNPRTEETRANLVGWPSATHDRLGTQKPICIRLLVTGKCLKENCKNAHVKPSTLSSTSKDAISTRLAGIYHP